MLADMGARAVVEDFWAAMADNDWARAAAHLRDGCVVDWPCTGERIVGRDDFVAVQEQHPTQTGRWTFDVHRLVADGREIVAQVEYWPAAYEPPPGREGLTRAGPRIP